jgi:hypothetical protein
MVSAVAGSDMTSFFARHVRGVETLPYDEAFGYVGLRFMNNRLEEMPNASAEARALRLAWLNGNNR